MDRYRGPPGRSPERGGFRYERNEDRGGRFSYTDSRSAPQTPYDPPLSAELSRSNSDERERGLFPRRDYDRDYDRRWPSRNERWSGNSSSAGDRYAPRDDRDRGGYGWSRGPPPRRPSPPPAHRFAPRPETSRPASSTYYREPEWRDRSVSARSARSEHGEDAKRSLNTTGGAEGSLRQAQSLSPANAYPKVALSMERMVSQDSERELGEISPDMPRGRLKLQEEGHGESGRGRSPVNIAARSRSRARSNASHRSRSSSGPTGSNAIAPLHVRELRATGAKQESSPPRQDRSDDRTAVVLKSESSPRSPKRELMRPDGAPDWPANDVPHANLAPETGSETQSIAEPKSESALQVKLEADVATPDAATELSASGPDKGPDVVVETAQAPSAAEATRPAFQEEITTSADKADLEPASGTATVTEGDSLVAAIGQREENSNSAQVLDETSDIATAADAHGTESIPTISSDLAVTLAHSALRSRRTHPIVHAVLQQQQDREAKISDLVSRVLERNQALQDEPNDRSGGMKFSWDHYGAAVIRQGKHVQSRLVQQIAHIKHSEALRVRRLRAEWERLDRSWQEQRTRVEAENEELGKIVEEMDKVNKPAPAVVEKPGSRKTRRGGYDPAQDALGIHDNDPAALARVLQQLRQADEADPNQRALKTEAVIPDMDSPHERWRSEDNTSLVADPLAFYADSFDTPWSEQEEVEFRRLYAKHPKQFGVIAAGLKGRSPGECVRHYYMVKKVWGFKEGAQRRAPITPSIELESFKGLSRPVTPRVDSTQGKTAKKRPAEVESAKVKRKPAAKRRVEATRAEKEAASGAVKRKRVKASKQVQIQAVDTEVARRPVGPQLGVFLPDATRSPTIVPTTSRGMNIQSLLNGSPAATLATLPPARPFDARSAASDATEEDANVGGAM